jgi:hypothetical protein
MSNQMYSIEEFREAHNASFGNIEIAIKLLEKGKAISAPAPERSCVDPTTWVKTFSDLCNVAGVKEEDYVIPVSGGTAIEMMNVYWRRLMVGVRALNPKGWVPDIADINQKKWCAYANVIPNPQSRFGFRLENVGCDYAVSNSPIGARPEFAEEKLARFHFENFTSDYEGFMFWQSRCKMRFCQ